MRNVLSFSTLGCPSWDWARILRAAEEYGYGAIELRGYRDQMDLPLAEPFTPSQRATTRQQATDAGVAFCCVSSSGVVAQGNLDHVRAHCELARDLGAPYVRVFGGKQETTLAELAETLRGFGEAAEQAGVAIVLETHDSFSTGATVAELLAETNHPAVFSLWDMHHPYRHGEVPETTHQLLAPTLRHVHVKDSRDGVYTLCGEGDIPLREMLGLALHGGYTGAISLEWEKRWHKDIADPEIAFPQYAKRLREMVQQCHGASKD